MQRIIGLLLLVVLFGCGGQGEDFSDCSIGRLTGTWHMQYVEASGTCGPIADETVMMGATDTSGSVLHGALISPDRCQMDAAFTSPTLDGLGTQTWTMVVYQVGLERLEGIATVQIVHPMGVCRSTYDIVLVRL